MKNVRLTRTPPPRPYPSPPPPSPDPHAPPPPNLTFSSSRKECCFERVYQKLTTPGEILNEECQGDPGPSSALLPPPPLPPPHLFLQHKRMLFWETEPPPPSPREILNEECQVDPYLFRPPPPPPPPASTQSWECYGPSGKAGTTQLSFIHFMDASLRVMLSNTRGAAVPEPGDTGIIMKACVVCSPVSVVSNRMDRHSSIMQLLSSSSSITA